MLNTVEPDKVTYHHGTSENLMKVTLIPNTNMISWFVLSCDIVVVYKLPAIQNLIMTLYCRHDD